MCTEFIAQLLLHIGQVGASCCAVTDSFKAYHIIVKAGAIYLIHQLLKINSVSIIGYEHDAKVGPYGRIGRGIPAHTFAQARCNTLAKISCRIGRIEVELHSSHCASTKPQLTSIAFSVEQIKV